MDEISEINWNYFVGDELEREFHARNDFIPNAECRSSPLHIEKIIEHILQKDEQNNQEPVEEKPKTKKFIPGKVYFVETESSCLTKKDQAQCVSALKLCQSGYDIKKLTNDQKLNLQVFTTLQSKIHEEHTKFLTSAENDWKQKNKCDSIHFIIRNYAYTLWRQKIQKCLQYPQFYDFQSVVPLGNPDNFSVEIQQLYDVLHVGVVPKFSCPSLTTKFILKHITLPLQYSKELCESKFPVSEDLNLRTIIENYDVDVIITLSALKKIIDDTNYNIPWDIPVKVKKFNVREKDKEDFQTKTIVYIEKPLPLQTPSNADFREVCYKSLIKTNFCQQPTIVHQAKESSRPNPNYINPNNVEVANENIEDLMENEEKNNTKKKRKNKFTSNINNAEGLEENIIHHNASYSIWNCKLNDDQSRLMKNRTEKSIKFLLRYKCNACEKIQDGTIRPLTIVPKMEYQLEYGANIPTKTELFKQWMDMFFRPFSHLYRVRINSKNSEVITVESVTLQKINNDAITHYQYKPHERLNALYPLFTSVTNLEVGNYLLHHTCKLGSFLEILKENTDKSNDAKTFDLHEIYNLENCKVVENNRQWCPIDVNYILPVHTVYKRMPGMFKPILTFPKNKTKGVTKKKKNKAKKEETQKYS